MEIPKTNLEDYTAFERDKNILCKGVIERKISREEYYKKIAALQEQYKDRIFPEDEYLFDNIGEFLEFLLDNNLPVDSIAHEMMHGTTAQKLGHRIKYGCRFVIKENQVAYVPFVQVLSDITTITTEDIKTIASAPGDLSQIDKNIMDIF